MSLYRGNMITRSTNAGTVHRVRRVSLTPLTNHPRPVVTFEVPRRRIDWCELGWRVGPYAIAVAVFILIYALGKT